MDKSTAVTFDYAKAAGLLSKSFINEKTQKLFEQDSLVDLWNLLFKEPVPLVPETLLARQIEQKALNDFLSQYIYFLNQFDNPPLILVDKLKRYEIENIKQIIDAYYSKQTELPETIDLKGFSNIKIKAWPDVKKIFSGTDYEWLNTELDSASLQDIDFKLDLNLLRENWNAINKFHGEEKSIHREFFLDEFIIKNIVWALRLKLFYKMPDDLIIKKLFYVGDSPSKSDPLAGPAIKILNFDVNKYSDWENWKYFKYINQKDSGDNWTINPSWIERKYMVHQAKFAYHYFHKNMMDDVALVAWFKIKNYELTCIKTAVESIKLNVSSDEAMEAVGVNG